MYVLFVISDGELKVTWNNTLFLVVPSSIASELKNLSGKIFEHGSEVYYARQPM